MIGVFDSGFGGLDILREVQKLLPQYQYIYLGDSERAPYGPRPPAEVHAFTLQAVQFLFTQHCELVIIACNTSSAEALRKIQQEFLPGHGGARRVLGVIVPAVEEAVHLTKNRRIGVLATEGTVQSGAFVRELQERDPRITVIQQAAPLLVPLIEAGEQQSAQAREAVKKYIDPLMEAGVDTVILGCTHYGHIESLVREVAGPDIKLLSEGPVVARKLKEYLARHPELEKNLTKGDAVRFYTTGAVAPFETHGSVFFGAPLAAQTVTLESTKA